jgi:hypothetical protein
MYKATVADKEILKDTDPSFRVLNLNNPFQETTTSFYHKSIGGYHAAKLRRYQELIDHRLTGEIQSIMKTFQQAKTADDVIKGLMVCPTLNMLNMRYIIYNPEQAPIRNPFAYGNAWFAQKVEMVDNADAEMAAMNQFNPLMVAVVDKRFAADLEGFTHRLQAECGYIPVKYKNRTACHLLRDLLSTRMESFCGWEGNASFPCRLDITRPSRTCRRTSDCIPLRT